jgi:hypothetical protein
VKDLIQRNRSSDRFRDGDGAARLMALVGVRRSDLTFDDVIDEIWGDFMAERGRGDFPSHFPLSVILHFIQGEVDDRLNATFITDKLLPELSALILDSLESIGVEMPVESIPADRICEPEPPESNLQLTVTRTWWTVCQAFNIITSSVTRFFAEIPPGTVQQLGDALFRFLIESRHYISVGHAQQTFQVVCTRCWARVDCAEFPEEWGNRLIQTAGSWTETDHRNSNGLVQTAIALIRSEPGHLFGSARRVYFSMLTLCCYVFEGLSSFDELRSALFLTEAIAFDNMTQANLEPYFSRLLSRVLLLICNQPSVELGSVAKRCLAKLLGRRPLGSPAAFFEAVPGILAFFSEHLVVEQTEIAYVILQMVQLIGPFSDTSHLQKVIAMRSSLSSRVRRAAARALLLLLPPERSVFFFRRCLRDLRLIPLPERVSRTLPDAEEPPESEAEPLEELEIVVPDSEEEDSEPDPQEELTACACDGIVVQMQFLIRTYPALRGTFREEIYAICDRFLQKQADSYMQIFIVVAIARAFDCLQRLRPLLLRLFAIRARLVQLPLGHHILRACLSVLDEPQIVELLQSGDDPTILHLLLQLKHPSPQVSSVCIDLFLRNKNEAITDVLVELLQKNPFAPSPEQRARFEAVLFEGQEDARMEAMLSLAPLFVFRPKDIFRHFERFSQFVDRSIQTFCCI